MNVPAWEPVTGVGPQVPDHVTTFTAELLRTGLMLAELAAELAETLPADAYPGVEPGAVVIEMITGTIRTALCAVEPPGERVVSTLSLPWHSRDG